MKSSDIKEITEALSRAQVAFKPIKRTEKVDYDTKSGSKKYNYAPLEVVIDATKQALSDNGLAVAQTTYLAQNNIILETILLHKSGEWLLGEIYVGKQDLPPQQLGSALTYMRRYAYSAILCVSSEEDDDGEGGGGNNELTGKTPTKVSKDKDIKMTPLELYGNAVQALTGADLCNFALKHGWTKIRLQTTLGINKSSDIKDVKTAALVLFPKPVENELVEEAKKLIAKGG